MEHLVDPFFPRLVYNWVILDLELSLFHDTTPLLSISELQCPLPGPKMLWMATTAQQWLTGINSVYGCTTNVSPHLLSTPSLTPSLFELFQDFLHGSLTTSRREPLEPQQLRLLLHPLQALLCHLRQTLSCFSNIPVGRRAKGRTVTKATTTQRLEEVQGLLKEWYELAAARHRADPNCAVTQCNLVLYHLISLNAVTSFPEVERLARKEGFDPIGPTHLELSLRHQRCIHQREVAIFHCGQALRLLRALPADRQPSWWGAAVYRVTMVLWTDGLSRLDPSFKTTLTSTPKPTPNPMPNPTSNLTPNPTPKPSPAPTAMPTPTLNTITTTTTTTPTGNTTDPSTTNSNNTSDSNSPRNTPRSTSWSVKTSQGMSPPPPLGRFPGDDEISTSALLMSQMPSPSPLPPQLPPKPQPQPHPQAHQNHNHHGSRGTVAVDQVCPEDPMVVAYLWGGDGTAVLTRADGRAVGLDDPSEVLDIGIKTLEAGVSTRFGDGLKRKLLTLARNWKLDSIGVSVGAGITA